MSENLSHKEDHNPVRFIQCGMILHPSARESIGQEPTSPQVYTAYQLMAFFSTNGGGVRWSFGKRGLHQAEFKGEERIRETLIQDFTVDGWQAN